MSEPLQMSFAQRVWYTLSRVDVEARLKQKTKFSYLPWADAWELLMSHYPESSYEFDEPKFWENETGEQWVTVTIREGDNTLSRRWWLPFLDHQNRPVINPSSLQINNTRMRVLVKCIAMMGLGVYVFSGEDVPDAQADAKSVGKQSVRGSGAIASVMADIHLDEDQSAEAEEWVIILRDCMQSKDSIDYVQLTRLCADARWLDNDIKVVIASRLESWQKTAMKKITAELSEKDRAAAVAKIQADD
jgi:hypothetical protein